MAAAVEKLYPDPEAHLPEEQREGFVLRILMENIYRQQQLEKSRAKRPRLVEQKRATP